MALIAQELREPKKTKKSPFSLKQMLGIDPQFIEKLAKIGIKSANQMIEAGKKYELAYEGNIDDGAVLLGQSIGIMNSVDRVSDIVSSIINDAEKRLKSAATLVK